METLLLRLSVALLGARLPRHASPFSVLKGNDGTGFLMHLICNIIFGSGENLSYSPGTGKMGLHIKVYSLISGAREQDALTSGSGWCACLRAAVLLYSFPWVPASSSPGSLPLYHRSHSSPSPSCLAHFSEHELHSELPLKNRFQRP